MRFCLVLLASSACASLPPYDYSKEPDPRKRGLVLGPSDELRVTVWREPELSSSVTVRPDGLITLPLVGDIRAQGLTPTELRQVVEKRLREFVKDESKRVTIAVEKVQSYRFTVSGRVAQPGSFSTNHFVSVAEAVAMAGGPTRFASPSQTILIRGGRQIPVDYPEVVAGKKLEQNLILMPGDTVFVP